MPQRASTVTRTPPRPHAGGFTFLDALFTIFILALGITALISTLTHGMQGVRQNRLGLIAAATVAREMEIERNTAFANLASRAFPVTDPTTGTPLPGAQGQVTVELYNGDPNLRRVTVTVTLDSARVWRLVTLVSR